MRISKIFHYLYFSVMALPLILAPIFAVYSHRHTIDSYDLQYAQNKVVDFNQTYQPYTDTWDGVTYTAVNNYYEISGTATETCYHLSYNLVPNDIYYVRVNFLNNLSNYVYFSFGNTYLDNNTISNNVLEARLQVNDRVSNVRCDVGFDFSNDTFNCQIETINLTQMFGSGNEPTLQQFNSWYSDDYYDFTLSHKELLKDYTFETLNDTDIMSQFSYNLYNSVNKYFNVSQFFGLNNLWDFMLLNWFGGNVTIYFEIFWQLLCYWLVVSIFWLIFDLFMFLPNLAHKWLDKGAIE